MATEAKMSGNEAAMKPDVALFRAQLDAGAAGLVEAGMIGVAANVRVPSLADPIGIVSGHREIERASLLDGTELHAIASQSKSFTAAVVLCLAREGHFALEDQVAKYVAGIPAVDGSATIEQFLNHTSGIGNYLHAMPTLPYPMPSFSYDDLMAMARAQGVQYRAGDRFDYNNTDVVVLARLCETVTGAPFRQLLQEKIFDPLGMADSFIADGSDWPRGRMAKGYYAPSQGYDGAPIDVTTLADFSVASAAGNIVSTLDDMLRWAGGLARADAPTRLSLPDMATNFVKAGHNPNWIFPPAYGRGVERWMWAGRPFWGHRGSFFGYHSATFLDPVSGGCFSMFLTTNTAGSFFRFGEQHAHAYMAFLEQCARTIVMLTDDV